MITVEGLKEALQQQGLGLFFTDSSLESLLCFTQRMLELNQELNLTKWTQDKDVLTFHLLDSAVSLPLLKELTQGKAQKWMDLGSGCGFPGAVLIPAFPQLEVILMDSVAKKVMALQECLQASGWKAKILQARAEDLGRDLNTREQWDGIVTRAVASLPSLLEYAVPLLKVGGYLVNWMTEEQIGNLDKSRNALQVLQAKVVKTLNYTLPQISQRRVLLVVEKLGKTPERYPRNKGIPQKRPL